MFSQPIDEVGRKDSRELEELVGIGEGSCPLCGESVDGYLQGGNFKLSGPT